MFVNTPKLNKCNLWVIVIFFGYNSTITNTFPDMFYPYNIRVPGVSLQLFLNKEGNSLSLRLFVKVVQNPPKSGIWLLCDCIIWDEIGLKVFHKLYLQRKPWGNMFRLQTTAIAHAGLQNTASYAVGGAKWSQTWAWKQNVHHSRPVLNSVSQFRWWCHHIR